jgi:hypothetical protein
MENTITKSYKITDDNFFIELQLLGGIAKMSDLNFELNMKHNYSVAATLKKGRIIQSYVFLKKHNSDEIWCVVEHSDNASLVVDCVIANLHNLSCNWCIRPVGFLDFEPECYDIKFDPSNSSVNELVTASMKLNDNIIVDYFKNDENITGIFPTISSGNEIVLWIFVVYKGFESLQKPSDENNLISLLSSYKCCYFEGLFHELMATQSTESAAYHGTSMSSPLCGSVAISNVLDNTLDGFGTLSYVCEHNGQNYGITCSHCLTNCEVIHPNIDKHLGLQWNVVNALKNGKSNQLKCAIEEGLKVGNKYGGTECNVEVHNWLGSGDSNQVFVDVGLLSVSNCISTKVNTICLADHDVVYEDEALCEESIIQSFRRIPYKCNNMELQFGSITSKFNSDLDKLISNTFRKNGARTGITDLNLVSVGIAKKYVDGRKFKGQKIESYFCKWTECRNFEQQIMCNQLLFLGQDRTACGVGDSGSIIFDTTDLTPIGLLHSGWGNRNDSRLCIATPMNAVEKQIDILLQK